MKIQNRVEIYCDGSCIGNPGPGGWAYIVRSSEGNIESSGGEPVATNNKMELMGAIKAIESINEISKIDVFTDSRYVIDGITKWIFNWKRKRWVTSEKKAVSNRELWERLDAAVSKHHVTWHWVKGHSGHAENERVDQMASEQARKFEQPATRYLHY